MRFLIQKYLLKKPLLIFLLILISLAIIQFKSQYKVIYDKLEPHTSSNPQAVEEFVKAVHYDLYIERLHNLVNYDSLLMKPLFFLKEYYFRKGQKFVAENDGIDIFFWMLLNKSKYLVTSNKYDLSIAYINLLPDDYKQINNKLYRDIKRYLSSNNFKSNTPNEILLKISFANSIVSYFSNYYHYQFYGTNNEKSKALYSDNKYYLQQLLVIYSLYEKFYQKYEKYFQLEKYIDKKHNYIYINTAILNDILYMNSKNSIKYFNEKVCQKNKIKTFLHNLTILYEYRDNENQFTHNVISGRIFKGKNNTYYYLTKSIYNTCQNLKQESKKILSYFKEINNGN